MTMMTPKLKGHQGPDYDDDNNDDTQTNRPPGSWWWWWWWRLIVTPQLISRQDPDDDNDNFEWVGSTVPSNTYESKHSSPKNCTGGQPVYSPDWAWVLIMMMMIITPQRIFQPVYTLDWVPNSPSNSTSEGFPSFWNRLGVSSVYNYRTQGSDLWVLMSVSHSKRFLRLNWRDSGWWG